MRKLLTLLAVVVLVSSCGGGIYQRDPVSVGPDNSELKISPCACLKVKQTTPFV